MMPFNQSVRNSRQSFGKAYCRYNWDIVNIALRYPWNRKRGGKELDLLSLAGNKRQPGKILRTHSRFLHRWCRTGRLDRGTIVQTRRRSPPYRWFGRIA